MIDAQFAAYEARCTVAAQLHAQILPCNRHVLFEALSAVGICVVTIDFEGSGDSGQMQSPSAFGPNNERVQLPPHIIAIKDVDFNEGRIFETSSSLADYLERLAYDFLEATYDGWENGDGAYGEFRFELTNRSIMLDYNERYVDTNFHQHEF